MGNMDDDETFRRHVWEGEIPLVFKMGPGEHLARKEGLDAFFMMSSRLSWVSLIRPAVFSYFSSFSDAAEREMWFEHQGIPLRWNFPIGVLVDLLVGDNPQSLPFVVNVHFSNYPGPSDLVRCDTETQSRWLYMNTRKQADLLKFGSNKKMMCLSRNDVDSLWDSVLKRDFGMYASVLRNLQRDRNDPISAVKAIPLRVFHAKDVERPSSFGGVGRIPNYIQHPIPPLLADGEPLTLYDALKRLFPDEVEGSDEETGSEVWARSRVTFVQGIQPPLNTPLLWLSESLCHSDGFLYVVLHPRDRKSL